MEACIKISGRVQGVGFRFWAVRMAKSIGNISGYVCNLPQGEVLVFMRGEKEALDEMLLNLYRGPLFSRVDKIDFVPELKSYFPPIENGVFKRL